MFHLSSIKSNYYVVRGPHHYDYSMGNIPAVAYDTKMLMQMGCGATHFNEAPPKLYTPDLPAVASTPKVQLLQEIANTSQLEAITNNLQMHLPGTDLDTFLKAYKQPKPLQWVPQ
jgi:hypothetical protein